MKALTQTLPEEFYNESEDCKASSAEPHYQPIQHFHIIGTIAIMIHNLKPTR